MPPRGRYNNDRNSYSYSNFNSNDNRRRQYHDRNEEPEWFSGGPTSQNDTIELRGFDTEFRQSSPNGRDRSDDKPSKEPHNKREYVLSHLAGSNKI